MFRSLLSGRSLAFCAAIVLVGAGSHTSGDDTVEIERAYRVTIPQPSIEATDAENHIPDAGEKVTESGADPSAPELPRADSVDVALAGPATVGTGDFVIVAIATATPGAELTFTYDPDPGQSKRAVFEEPGSGRRLIVFIQPPANRYRIALIGQITSEGRDPFDVAVHDVTVGRVAPTPTPDVDPVPPGPEPEPEPEPTPDTAPFPADGLHVLVVYESSKMNSLTPDQRAIIQGADVRAALKAAAPERHRFYDPDADLTYAAPVWKAAMAVPRESVPWVAISNGRTGYSGPLDMTPAEFKALLSEFK